MKNKRSIVTFIVLASSIVSFVPIWGVPFGAAAIILGIIELFRIRSGKSVGPKPDVYAGIVIGFFGGMISLAIALALGAK